LKKSLINYKKMDHTGTVAAGTLMSGDPRMIEDTLVIGATLAIEGMAEAILMMETTSTAATEARVGSEDAEKKKRSTFLGPGEGERIVRRRCKHLLQCL
jgi:hypothetical protein